MENAKLYEKLIQFLPDGLLIVDAHGMVEMVNPCAAEMFGYSVDEMHGISIAALVPFASSENHHQHVDHYMQHPQKRAMGSGKRLSGQRKDGTLIPVSISLNPVELDGETKIITLVRDMSEVVTVERQFEQAQKMKEVGSLAAGVSHDFNNMLAAITCQLYLVRGRLADRPDLVEELTSIERHAFEAADMIRQLLAFSRKGNMEIKHLSMHSLVTESLRLHTSTLPSNIAVELDICSDRLMVQADPIQLQQVLLNLLNNAKHAMYESSQKKLCIALQPFHADEAFLKRHSQLTSVEMACLSVSDTGHGIAEDKLEEIFEPFFTTKQAGHGTGLGLAMIASAIKHYGGVIDVESKEGQGSTFRIYLPIDESEVAAIDESKEVLKGQGETILLVDDNEAAREAMARLLVELNYQVIEASDGVMAVDQFNSHADQIALVILDVIMPRMGGMDAARWIRGSNPGLPVLFVTAYDRSHVDSVLENSLALSKPVPIHRLSQSIRSLLPIKEVV